MARLKTEYGFEPTVSAAYLGQTDNRDTTRFYAARLARELRECGVSVNLAPVLDIGGDTPDKVNHVYFDNVRLFMKKQTDYPSGVYDRRPCRDEGFIRDKVFGVYVDQAVDIFTDGVQVVWEKPLIPNRGDITN